MSFDPLAAVAWLLEHSLRVAALIVVVGAGSLLMRRASAHGRLFAWTVVLHLAVAMPLLAMMLPEVRVPSVFTAPIVLVPVATDVAPVTVTGADAPAAATAWSVQSALPLVYAAGAAILLLRLFVGWWMTMRVVRRARVVVDLEPGTAVQILESASVHVPFACGVVRPAVVLPASWRSWDAVTRQAVLAHELSHIARRDLWALRLAAIYRAVTWLNPLSWWLRRKLEMLAERASDDAVLAAGVEPTTYAEVLVSFFEAAQRSPGRASWQLAMARRGDVEARKRVGRVLSAREGGNVRFGMPGRVLVGVGVLVAAVPVIMLASQAPEAVVVQRPPVEQPERIDIKVKVDVLEARQKPVKTVEIVFKDKDKPKTVDIKLTKVDVKADVKADVQEQEEEPWRSTRRVADPDVVAPKTSTSVHPKYTPDAMRAKIQGTVEVEVIVSASGIVSNARVTKSLDTQFGLDGEALKAATQWTFIPGTYQGEPTAIRARIVLEFRLH